MAGGCKNSGSLYAALGVASDCSDADLRGAYIKLVRKWHPDKCSSSGSVETAKARFQKIQGAYAVLSDPNKRILYDVGAYDSDGDDDGVGEILCDILDAMNQASSTENGRESAEDLQKQFEELFLKPSPSLSLSDPANRMNSNGNRFCFETDDVGRSSKKRAGRK